MKDHFVSSGTFQEWYAKRPVSRRAFGVGAVGAAVGLTVGCSDSKKDQPNSTPEISDPKQEAFMRQLLSVDKNAREKHGMEKTAEFEMDSGIKVVIYGNNGIQVDPAQFNMAFNAGFSVLDQLTPSEFKNQMIRAQQEKEAGIYKGRQVVILAPGAANSCVGKDASFITVQTAAQRESMCGTYAAVSPILPVTQVESQNIQQNGIWPQAPGILMFLTAGVVDGTKRNSAAGGSFDLNDQQAMGANVTHEAMHGFLRFLGGQRPPQEEGSIQVVENRLLTQYQEGLLPRPLPFKFR